MINASTSQMAKNLSQAKERFELLFIKEKSKEEILQQRKTSESAVDHYLNNEHEGRPLHHYVSPEAREFMIMLDIAVCDLHPALPFGREDLVIRSQDGSINHIHTISKMDLCVIGKHIDAQLNKEEEEKNWIDPTDPEPVLKRTAISLFKGSSTCQGYGEMLEIVVAYRRSQMEEPAGTVKFEVSSMPKLKGKQVDHFVSRMTYTDQDGNQYIFVNNPWEDANTPVLDTIRLSNGTVLSIGHSKYTEGLGTFESYHLEGPSQEWLEIISYYMDESAGIPVQNVEYVGPPEKALAALQEAAVASQPRYDMEEPLGGLVDGPINNTNAKSILLRRPSLSSALNSPLLSSTDPEQ